MKDSHDIQSTTELQPSAQGTNEVQSNQPNPMATDAPAGDSGSLSVARNDNRKVSREDIELVQNLIERCLQLYMNKGEVVRTLSTRARIEPGFTTLVWQKLEEENSEFFGAYYIRLKLKRQIVLFNHLLQHQYNLMKYPAPPNVPLAPMQNGIHPMPVNNLPMGYPVLQQPIMPAPGQPYIDSMARGVSNGHVVNGIPAPGGYHPVRMNSGNDMAEDNGAPEAEHAGATCSAISSEIAVSPSSAASSNHAPFTPSEIPVMAMDTSALDSTFGSDVGNTGPLQLGPDGSSRDSIRSLGQLWNFSISDFAADLTSLGADSEEGFVYTSDREAYEVLVAGGEGLFPKNKPAVARSAVEALPSAVVAAGKEGEGVECAVCRDGVAARERVKRLPCSHRYHEECIVPWLEVRNSCPLCRFELPTDDPEYETWKAGRAAVS